MKTLKRIAAGILSTALLLGMTSCATKQTEASADANVALMLRSLQQ